MIHRCRIAMVVMVGFLVTRGRNPARTRIPSRPLRVASVRVSWWPNTRRLCCPSRACSKTFTKNGWKHSQPLGRCSFVYSYMCNTFRILVFDSMFFFFGCTKKCVSLLATSVLQERMEGIVFYCWCLGLFFWRRKKGRCFTEVVCFLFFFWWGPVCRSMKIQVRFLSSTDLFVGKSKSNR